ncbi:gamma-glutamylaminecyclotransferase A [Danio rerio]|uniref:Gamma-glutamylaminecyclotransferase A n=1 Tax=Danio rerio TaxID=7955 RepID=GGACA_DANRE|nr:gamma-glutamylaminecyclotransferase A precursor [Danio rerio]A0JMM9.1 RecName: Full=Gamma-glutamylaminecyclotransferase A; Short=GGACT A; AltName: Full=AIG2-like domain-containing protein 1-A; AltName: Full=Gamma-glutamylamine cyclotransferase A; AltName: Full=Gamma-glutamylamine cyclotransferase, tandem duplicate 1 [Danio rerio]AAI25939.1 Zgc:154024 [Danio rerio]|eukprot:NP_001071185.1 gamma-glutamylaminecyclotransferase A precursor [Danio rerio]
MIAIHILLLVFSNIVLPALCINVFVYGTLKKGQSNYHELTNTTHGQAEFITCARTKDPYPMVIATKDKFPFLLNVPGSGQQVYGEIYNVDQNMLDFLDEFEECPDLYQRTSIQLKILKGNGDSEEAFVYSTSTFDPDWLNKPTFSVYDATGDPGNNCVSRE